ncbi:hypothetical protein [Neobacillus terrae]|uniref:hypothetical protein n=1 Tax=Neobacillus terrae TaxID=3034837 RepID=UPI00140E1EB2|nr:hypothetical protein [Neobacillus terrae]NHM30553.1 hypothetical protein [Neobacillus terrae]
MGKEEAPASHLIDAILSSWQVLRKRTRTFNVFRKVWVYYIRTFLFVKGTLEYPGHVSLHLLAFVISQVSGGVMQG